MYRDPLHVPSAELVVWFRDKETILLNKRLLDRQNCWENLELIKSLHVERLTLEELIVAGLFLPWMNLLVQKWTENQFRLQDAWKFVREARFHKPWYIPGCKCPKMDNDDMYPSGIMVRTMDCPVHYGVKDEKVTPLAKKSVGKVQDNQTRARKPSRKKADSSPRKASKKSRKA